MRVCYGSAVKDILSLHKKKKTIKIIAQKVSAKDCLLKANLVSRYIRSTNLHEHKFCWI